MILERTKPLSLLNMLKTTILLNETQHFLVKRSAPSTSVKILLVHGDITAEP